jgi:SAM-dependent methyltransferase
MRSSFSGRVGCDDRMSMRIDRWPWPARLFHNASRVIALEPDPGMRKRLAPKLPTARCEVEVLGAPAEALPLRDQTVDAVVFTCVPCSVEDVDQALAEARRTLKPHGRPVVLEHVRGDGRLARWQDAVTPVWSCLAGGCHPNRDIEPAVLRAGFAIERAERFDPFPRLVPTRPMLEATARPAEAIERSRRSAPAR